MTPESDSPVAAPGEENPYRSPRQSSVKEVPPKQRRPGVSARLLSKSFFYRRILIEAPIEAMLEYRGWGIEHRRADRSSVVWPKATSHRSLGQRPRYVPSLNPDWPKAIFT